MKIRIIGVSGCKICKNLAANYTAQGVQFEYWDGERDDLQDTLDKMGVYDFPVVQILNDEDKILWASDPIVQRGGVSYKKVLQIMENLSRKK